MLETSGNLPTIVMGESLRQLPFTLTPHPEEFARLARAVGIPESEIANLHIRIVAQRGLFSSSGVFYLRSREILLEVRDKRKPRIRLADAVHELDHYNYTLTHPPVLPQRHSLIRSIAGSFNTSQPHEKHARETVERIRRSRDKFTLISVSRR